MAQWWCQNRSLNKISTWKSLNTRKYQTVRSTRKGPSLSKKCKMESIEAQTMRKKSRYKLAWLNKRPGCQNQWKGRPQKVIKKSQQSTSTDKVSQSDTRPQISSTEFLIDIILNLDYLSRVYLPSFRWLLMSNNEIDQWISIEKWQYLRHQSLNSSSLYDGWWSLPHHSRIHLRQWTPVSPLNFAF